MRHSNSHIEYLRRLRRTHKRCGCTMRIANLIVVERDGDWPYFECRQCQYAEVL